MTPNSAIRCTKDWIMMIGTIEMWMEAAIKPPATMPSLGTVTLAVVIISCTEFHSIMLPSQTILSSPRVSSYS